MVYGHCMAKSSAFLKQMSSESSSSLNIDYGLSFFFTENIVRCSGVLREKKRKFIPKPGMVYNSDILHTVLTTFLIIVMGRFCLEINLY